MTMGSFAYNVWYVAHHPEFFVQYLTRERTIGRFLGVDKSKVSGAIRECSPLTQKIFTQLKNEPYYGQMDKRKNEAVYALIRLSRPRFVVETGVAAGVSSYYILDALHKNGEGTLTSIDIRGKLPNDKPTGWLVPRELRNRWTLLEGSSKSLLPNTVIAGCSVDFFLHDSEHSYENMTYEYSTIWISLADGGLVVSDNIEWNTAFNDFCQSKGRRPIQLYGLGITRK